MVEFDYHVGENVPIHEESAIVCNVIVNPERERKEGEEIKNETIYLVSRGNEADNVFVYAHKNGHKISLLNLSSHIRNVYEWELPVGSPTESTINNMVTS